MLRVKNGMQVRELKALRELATELYSYNSMTLEAAEIRGKLADMQLQQAAQPAVVREGESQSVVEVDIVKQSAVSDSQLPETSERVESLQQIKTETETETESEILSPASEVSENGAKQLEKPLTEQSDGVAEFASKIWNDAAESGPAPAEQHRNGAGPLQASSLLREEGSMLEQEVQAHSVEAEDRRIEPEGHQANGQMWEGTGSEGTPQKEASVEVAVELLAGGVNLPHPGKAASGGEDAFFVSAVHGGGIGVADGVSGWAQEGVDAALYSRFGNSLKAPLSKPVT